MKRFFRDTCWIALHRQSVSFVKINFAFVRRSRNDRATAILILEAEELISSWLFVESPNDFEYWTWNVTPECDAILLQAFTVLLELYSDHWFDSNDASLRCWILFYLFYFNWSDLRRLSWALLLYLYIWIWKAIRSYELLSRPLKKLELLKKSKLVFKLYKSSFCPWRGSSFVVFNFF